MLFVFFTSAVVVLVLDLDLDLVAAALLLAGLGDSTTTTSGSLLAFLASLSRRLKPGLWLHGSAPKISSSALSPSGSGTRLISGFAMATERKLVTSKICFFRKAEADVCRLPPRMEKLSCDLEQGVKGVNVEWHLKYDSVNFEFWIWIIWSIRYELVSNYTMTMTIYLYLYDMYISILLFEFEWFAWFEPFNLFVEDLSSTAKEPITTQRFVFQNRSSLLAATCCFTVNFCPQHTYCHKFLSSSNLFFNWLRGRIPSCFPGHSWYWQNCACKKSAWIPTWQADSRFLSHGWQPLPVSWLAAVRVLPLRILSIKHVSV